MKELLSRREFLLSGLGLLTQKENKDTEQDKRLDTVEYRVERVIYVLDHNSVALDARVSRLEYYVPGMNIDLGNKVDIV